MVLSALITGGKDSIYALHEVIKRGREVRYLVTMVPEREDSWLFHFPNIQLVDLIAETISIPLVKRKTAGVKGKELRDLEKALRGLDIDGVVCGAIASRYQRSRIERLCHKLNLEFVAPLWGRNPEELLRDIILRGFDVIMVGVYAYGFDQNWLGRKIDDECLRDLISLRDRYRINVAFEGGEAETLVLDCPLFKKRIQILGSEVIWDSITGSGYLKVKKARLVTRLGSPAV